MQEKFDLDCDSGLQIEKRADFFLHFLSFGKCWVSTNDCGSVSFGWLQGGKRCRIS